MPTIRNNTPRVYFQGIEDKSVVPLQPELEAEPIHLPLLYVWGQRGPEAPVLCGPNGDFARIYGSESLNERSPYFTHQTKMLQTITSQSNSVLVKRMFPADSQVAGLTLVCTIIRKTPSISVDDTWNPNDDIPLYVPGKAYRIVGLTVDSYEVLGEIISNGDIVTFIGDGDSVFIDDVIRPSGMFYRQSRNGAGVLKTDAAGNPLYAFTGTVAVSTDSWDVSDDPVIAELDNDGVYTVTGLATGATLVIGGKTVKNGDIVTINSDSTAIDDVYYSGVPQTKAILTANGQFPDTVVGSVILKWDWVEVDYDVNGNLSDAHTKVSLETYGTDETGGVLQALRFPIKTLLAPSPGEYGNNIAIREWVDTRYSNEVVEDNRALTLKAQFLERAAPGKPAYVQSTLKDSTVTDFTYNPAAFNEFTKEDLYVDNLVRYYNDDGLLARTSPTFGPVGTVIVHDLAWDTTVSAIPALVAEFTQAISDGVTTCIDFVYDYVANVEAVARSADGSAVDTFDPAVDQRLLNIFTGVSTQAYLNGVSYYGFKIGLYNDGTKANEAYPTYSEDFPNNVVFNNTSTYWFGGGIDGTMDNTTYEEALAYEINENYNNPEYALTDTGRYPFSAVYDSGFTMSAKPLLNKWLGYRPDVHVTLATHAEGEKLSQGLEEARASELMMDAQQYTESEEFGTKCVRCVIVAQSGQLIQGSYRKRLPLTLELAYKRAGYLGAGNGVIKYGFDYTENPLNSLSLFNPGTVNNVFMDDDDRERLWMAGANYVQFADRSTLFNAALQTIYDPRNSVLTSELLMQIAVDVTKQLDKVWKLNSGDTQLTPEQFLERCNEDIVRLTAGKYGTRVVVEPNSFYTAADTARGYSWNMNAIIRGNVMKTTAAVSVTMQRNFD